jgi:hypothetical protein
MDQAEQQRLDILDASTAFYQATLSQNERIVAYLRARHLSDETIQAARLGYAAGGLKEHLLERGHPFDQCQEAGVVRDDGRDFFHRRIVIPYLSGGRVGLLRGRSDPEDPDDRYKYLNLPKQSIQLYGGDALADATMVVMTEGEFDALIVRQWGIPAVGLPGASAFKEEWVKLFERCERVYLCLDTDAAGQKAAWQAAELLGDKALIVQLPEGKDASEYAGRGHTAEEFAQLLTQAKSRLSLAVEGLVNRESLEARIGAVSKIFAELVQKGPLMVAAYQEPICQAMGWRKKDFELAVKEAKRKHQESATAKASTHAASVRESALILLDKADQTTWLHPAMDFCGGVFWYGLPVGTGLLFVNSQRRLFRTDELPQHVQVLDVGYTMRRLSTEAVKRYVNGETVPGHLLIERLRQFLCRFVVFRDVRTPVMIAIWIMGTYLYILFRYYGYLLIRSPEKRCGKTLLEALLSSVSFNATTLLTHPTTAQLYRGPTRTRGTQIFDEIDRLRPNKELFGDFMAVLDGGFQRGSTVLRYERVGERLEERAYDPYAPRVLAGIATVGLPDVLEDRSIAVTMHRRQAKERIERFNPRRLDQELQEFRDALGLWALGHAEELAQVYEQMEELPVLTMLDDRLRDIWEPLVAIGLLADAERNDSTPSLVNQLMKVAEDLYQFRAAAEQETPTVALIQAILKVRDTSGEHVTPTDLLEGIRCQGDFGWLGSTKKLGELLRPLGLVSKAHRFPTKSDPQRAYQLDKALLEELLTRYTAVQATTEAQPVYTSQDIEGQGVTV